MKQTLTEIAQSLIDGDKKVKLIYAFNGIGKTRLSREFRLLVDPKVSDTEDETGIKVLYYNAYTEDLFFWDNDLVGDVNRKLTIRPSNFTNLTLQFLKDQGLDGNIANNFQHFTNPFLTPIFSQNFSEVTFSIQAGDNTGDNNIKISKGEESNFIWCIFYTLLEQVVDMLNIPEPESRASNKFNELQYVFIDDPVSSLDENHLIELAVNLAELIKKSSGLKFIISTHNPLFYNVLYNELNLKSKKEVSYYLGKNDDGTYEFTPKQGDSNKSFSYHLYLKHTIEEAIKTETIQKYHFMLLRNLYEKTASFLEYPRWSELLPEDKQLYYNRVIQFTSHSTLSNEVVAEPTEPEKQTVKLLLDHLVNSKYWKEEIANSAIAEPEITTTELENGTI